MQTQARPLTDRVSALPQGEFELSEERHLGQTCVDGEWALLTA